ncbi:MAG: polysaccharide deacetylase family protein [Pseudomonadota bacterium]
MTTLAPGVCLTFDDLFVANWLAAAPIFAEQGAVATFCVARLHDATADQIAGLHTLQDAGHEIAFHSRTHPKLKPYLAEHGVEHWVAHEIDKGVAEHRAAGFPATAFASPFHASTPKTRKATGARFLINRYGGPRGVTAETMGDRIYTHPGPQRGVHNIGSIDFRHPVQGGWDWLREILDALVERQGVGVFTGHDIRAGNGKGFYSTPDDIARLLHDISARGLRTYTLSGFAQVKN